VENEAPTPAPRSGSTPRNYSGTDLFASDAARTTMRDLARQYSLTEIAAWPIAPLQVHCSVFRIPADRSREDLLTQLTGDRRVRLAQPMNIFASRSQTYNDPYLDVQRGFRDIDAAGAQQWSLGEHVRVAVIDTGLDAGHPDFGGALWSAQSSIATQSGLNRPTLSPGSSPLRPTTAWASWALLPGSRCWHSRPAGSSRPTAKPRAATL
jgi:hypothetical protein